VYGCTDPAADNYDENANSDDDSCTYISRDCLSQDGTKIESCNWREDKCPSGNIDIPEGVTEIFPNAFTGCKEITGVTFPDSLKSIHENAFKGCSKITALNLPEGLELVGYQAFRGCVGVESIYIPSTLVSAAPSSFELGDGTKNSDNSAQTTLKKVVYGSNKQAISSHLKTAGKRNSGNGYRDIPAFCKADKDKGACLPVCDSQENCEEKCDGSTTETACPEVQGCTDYKTSTNFNPLANKNDGCIAVVKGCMNSTADNYNPEANENDESCTFPGCTDRTANDFNSNANVDDGSCTYNHPAGDVRNCVYNDILEECNNVHDRGKCPSGDIVIPEGVRWIEDDAFKGCTEITGVVFPSTLEIIDHAAFKGCSGIISLDLPEGLKSVGTNAFLGCTSVESIHIPSTLELSQGNAFKLAATGGTNPHTGAEVTGSSLEKVYYNSGVMKPKPYLGERDNPEIKKGTFCFRLGDYCLPLCESDAGCTETCNDEDCIVRVEGCTDPTASNYNSEANIDDNSCESTNVFGTGDGCKTSPTNYGVQIDGCNKENGACPSGGIEIPEGVTYIERYAFRGCTEITSVKFPSTLKLVGQTAFKGCSGIKELNFWGTNLERIGYRAFLGCTNVESIYIPHTLGYLYPDSFLLTMGTEVGVTDSLLVVHYEETGPPQNIINPNTGTECEGHEQGNCLPVCDSPDCTVEISVLGCTDSAASNYNPAADIDDGSCEDSSTVAVPGCTDSDATNYDSAATQDDGSCEYENTVENTVVSGCTDSTASNYNSAATQDDGSCHHNVAPTGDSLSYDWGVGDCDCSGSLDDCSMPDHPTMTDIEGDAAVDNSNCAVSLVSQHTPEKRGNYVFREETYELCDPVIDEALLSDCKAACDSKASCFGFSVTHRYWDESLKQLVAGKKQKCSFWSEPCPKDGTSDDRRVGGQSSSLFNHRSYTKTSGVTDNVYGCTDPSATNWNHEANSDDGSCVWLGCMDVIATNYNSDATVDDGSCEYEVPSCDCAVAWNDADSLAKRHAELVAKRACGDDSPLTVQHDCDCSAAWNDEDSLAARHAELVVRKKAPDCDRYDPCEGKQESDSCTLCDPSDESCVETAVVKRCRSGKCEA